MDGKPPHPPVRCRSIVARNVSADISFRYIMPIGNFDISARHTKHEGKVAPGMKQAGMLELPVLGLLKERAMHGYELRKQLGAMLGPFWQVSWGSLYPTLRRLAEMGPSRRWPSRPSLDVPATTAKSSRTTMTGRAAQDRLPHHPGRGSELFTDMLEESAASVDAEHFTLKLAFFRYLEPEARLALARAPEGVPAGEVGTVPDQPPGLQGEGRQLHAVVAAPRHGLNGERYRVDRRVDQQRARARQSPGPRPRRLRQEGRCQR